MTGTDAIYTELQKHLDKQAVGFPATQSGVEIRLLKELFTPEQASLALHLSYQPKSALDIFSQVKSSGMSLDSVKNMLEEMERNGAIGSQERNKVEYYYTIPLLIGIVEWHGYKATPQFWKDFSEYSSSEFRKVFTSTKISQMRTIPVRQSLGVEHRVTTYDHVREIINNTEGRIAIATCMCREGAKGRGEPCKVTSRTETCMVFGDFARHFIKLGLAREVTREEALEISRQNETEGLVLQPSNNQKIDFICSCCGCCCGILKIQKTLPNPAAHWAHNFYSEVVTEMCTACGICVEKCQVNAATINEQTGYATINLDRCIGCGNCVSNCPSDAMHLVKVEVETAPPLERADLYRILADKG